MIELNGIQISDNNINTKKNVKIYVDEKQLDSKVGELSNLKTTDKSSIVNAINEVKDTTDTLQVDVNRIYSDFTIIPNTPTEQEFTYKKSDEGVIEKGVAVIDKVKGNSVVWNQLIKDFREPSNWLTNNCDVTVVGNKIHIKFTSVSSSSSFGVKSSAFSTGHKYCVLMNNENAIPLTAIKLGSESGVGTSGSTLSLNLPTISIAIPKGSVGAGAFWFWPSDETKLEGDFSNIYAIDLTQMFGAGNEPATYEEFLSRKPKVADEFAYNEGTIVNNKVEKVVTTGRNLCPYLEQGTLNISNGSEQPSTTRVRTPFIPISNKHSYCTMHNKWAIRNGCFYDRNKNFISLGYPSIPTGVLDSSNIPANAAFCRLVYSAQNGTDAVTPSYDVFMFAIGNTTIPTTKYEPYEEHTLDLSWIKEIKDTEGVKLFEDGMKSAGTAFDEVGKNKAVKRLGVKVFDGTEEFSIFDTYPSRFWFLIQDAKKDAHTLKANLYGKGMNTADTPDKTVGYSGGMLAFCFRDSEYTTVESFKQHLADLYAQGNPLTVIYELAEPIKVEYDEKNLTYPVIAGGTEEAIASESSTPMRASITYGSNTVATILSLMNRVNELERKIIN